MDYKSSREYIVNFRNKPSLSKNKVTLEEKETYIKNIKYLYLKILTKGNKIKIRHRRSTIYTTLLNDVKEGDINIKILKDNIEKKVDMINIMYIEGENELYNEENNEENEKNNEENNEEDSEKENSEEENIEEESEVGSETIEMLSEESNNVCDNIDVEISEYDNNEENEFNPHILNKYTVGDNLEILKNMEENSVNMIYMDPPYNTGRDFGDFNDKYNNYYNFMKSRIIECHRILKKDGNIIIHVEANISHHIRYICDEIFGESRFKNEIIWKTGGNAKNKYKLGRSHDNIIVYSKSNKSKFNPLYIPYDDEEVEKYPLCPHHNMRYGNSAAHNSQPDVNPRPNLRYTWNGHYKQWYYCEEKMKKLHDDHRLVYNANGIPRIKRFFKEQSGIPIRDLWNDIPSIQSKEKIKYATQKPIKLLDRIINLYSDKDDICLDPFAGSGTLGRSCLKNKRKYILLDINNDGKSIFEESIS